MSPRVLFATGVVLGAVIVLNAHPVEAQVYADLEPVTLEYRITLEDESVPIGSAEISFEPIETKRGPRLQVESMIEYTLNFDTPFSYREEATLICDDRGPVTFETTAQAGGLERKNSALRMGDDYHVTTDFNGQKHQKTITANVRRTNLGLFCAGYLEEPLDQGKIIEDYPLLYPVGGDHQARQRYQEATVKIPLTADRGATVFISTMRKVDKKKDRYWHVKNKYQILIRMEESTNYGVMTYELTAVNGVPPEESELIR
jgi:hypothetical protein